MPKISVIIPVYNVEPFIREGLDSVINQTLKDIEIICVDDCSTDNSLNIMKDYAQKDNRVKIIEQKINQGEVVAKYKGALNASSEYISTLDPDDYFAPDMLEIMYNEAIKNNSDMVCCNIQHIRENGKITHKILKVTTKNKTIILNENFINKINPGTPNKLIKKELFINSMNFTERDIWKDFYQFWRGYSLKDYRVTLINKPLYFYRKRSTSITHSNKNKKLFDESLLKTADLILDYLFKNKRYEYYKKSFWFTMSDRIRHTYKNKHYYKIQKMFYMK